MKRNLYREDFRILSLVIIVSFYYLFTYINSPINYAALILFLISILMLFASFFILLRTDVRYSIFIQAICIIVICLVIIAISSLTIVKEIKLKSYVDNVSKIIENNKLDYTSYNMLGIGGLYPLAFSHINPLRTCEKIIKVLTITS